MIKRTTITEYISYSEEVENWIIWIYNNHQWWK